MDRISTDRTSGFISREIRLVTADGVTLAGTWFLPDSTVVPPLAVIVVLSGGGITARRYHGFARFLAGKGAAALTFDYRGIGASRDGNLRLLEAGTEHWAYFDFGAALAVAAKTFPELPLEAVAHSVSGLFVGAAPDALRLKRLVFFGPHTGYYGDYRVRWRWLLYLTWHVMMPLVTRIVGYFPGRALGLGEDLPRGFALDWADRRQPSLVATPEGRDRFGPILERYKVIRAQALVLSVSDDAFAPPEAGRRLISVYPNIEATHEIISPSELGRRRLGHLAFLRRSNAAHIWERAAAWLLHSKTGGRASEDASLAVCPPSGTKGSALAGSAAP